MLGVEPLKHLAEDFVDIFIHGPNTRLSVSSFWYLDIESETETESETDTESKW